jgi:hypothetical protein
MKKPASDKVNQNTGSQTSPKTNQDFNQKKPNPGDPELKTEVEALMARQGASDLLEDETADPGDADGNGNLINEYDDEFIANEDDRKKSGHKDEHVSREDDLKNTHAREI